MTTNLIDECNARAQTPVGHAELRMDGSDAGGQNGEENRVEETWWSASRAQIKADDKTLMAREFVNHEFLVPEGQDPEDNRETAASILVNQGTSQNRVVEEAMEWIKSKSTPELSNPPKGPFFLTWYTPGHLVPNTLRRYREKYKHVKTATSLFLFPGEVDLETESVSGPDAESFAQNLQRKFTYAFLSANAFDVSTGSVYFHWPRELCLQRACATRFADHKYLFLDSSKFRSQGEEGYRIRDLLETAHKVTIYTVATPNPRRDKWIMDTFKKLCMDHLKDPAKGEEDDLAAMKTLRLVIVGRGEAATVSDERSGVLGAISSKG